MKSDIGFIIFHPSVPLLYHPPFPPFFFFCGCFLRVDGAGFCCRGGTTLLADAAVVLEPGLGDVGGLLAVLLASLKHPNGTGVFTCISMGLAFWQYKPNYFKLQRVMIYSKSWLQLPDI